ncbi:MAG: hypothetical protein WBA76_13250 [Phormidesmis sp.]
MRLNIRLDLTSEQVQQHLLAGLDSWVELGLLSEVQVRELAQAMSQPILPAAAIPAGNVPAADEDSATNRQTVADEILPKAAPKVSRAARALRSLLEEISVVWLLFLGVFLVVVSSGLLAASQWQSFSPVGQYAILLAYTLVFWGASLWAQRQEALQATAKMLALTVMLLIPINFWMMDAVGLRNTPVGIGVGILSALLLSCLLSRLLSDRANQLNAIGLSWLHFGWIAGGWAFWPMAATYLGTVGTAANLAYQDSHVEDSHLERSPQTAASRARAFDWLALSLSVLMLLFRSLVVVQVPPHQLGLAAGICGWLLVWLNRRRASRETPVGLWQWAGFGLLLLGWAIAIGQQPPLQAIAISGLTLWLIWDRLKLSWQKEYLLALIGVAGQTYWLLSGVIPPSTRDTLLAQLAQRLSSQPVSKVEWMSLGFLPFVWGLLWFARRLRHWHQPALSRLTEGVALAMGISLTVFSAGTRFTLAANLLLLAITLFAVVRRRPRIEGFMVTLAHAFGLGAITAVIHYFQPNLAILTWAYILLFSGLAELALHLLLRSDRWRQNTWGAGLCLFSLSYMALVESWSLGPDWIWLVVPIALTFVANQPRALHPAGLAKLTLLAAMLQTPWLSSFPVAIASFAIGTLCLLINSRVWQSRWAALFTVGSGVACITSLAWHLMDLLSVDEAHLLAVWALEIWALWLLARMLVRQGGRLSVLYQSAARAWGAVLMVGLLLLGTLWAGADLGNGLASAGDEATGVRYMLLATTLLIAALLESIRYRPAEWRYWSLAWAIEVTVVLGLNLRGVNLNGIAVATLALGIVSQILADVWVLRRSPYRASWHAIPVLYAGLGVLLGHGQVGAQLGAQLGSQSGLFTIFAGAIAIGIGRRQASLNPLSYIGLAALSLGAYELLIYRMLQASGGRAGDGFTLLALLALLIALVERFCSPWLLRYMLIPAKGLRRVAHAHWLLSSLLALAAAAAGLSQPKGIALWTGIALLLAGYALMTGNRRCSPQTFVSNHTVWTGIGIVEVLLCAVHNRLVWLPDRTFLVTWGGIVACVMSFAIYQLPWERWGWPLRPWQLLARSLPLAVLGVAISDRVPTQSLLIVGAFYAWMAKQRDQVRLSYLSVLLFDWALLRYLDEQGWLTALAFSLVAGVSLLYVAEVEPYFRGLAGDLSPDGFKRQQRHWLRSLASGLMGITALYQAESDRPLLLYAAITLALCTGLILAGLALKVRAFLYVGTGTFVLQIIRVLWRFINDNSLLLWAVGIVLGLAFIWVAATFESRRGQVTHRLESWNAALQSWD